MTKTKLYQCPYDAATKCRMNEGCAGCIEHRENAIFYAIDNSMEYIYIESPDNKPLWHIVKEW